MTIASAGPRVLVVDDERFFRESLRELLEAVGVDVALAADAAEALEAARDPRVGVVVLDIVLPDQSGLAVLRALRERRPDVRVVMLSAHSDQEYVLEALRLGACDYLAKPLHEEEVRLSVARALESWRLATSFGALRGRLVALTGEVERLQREDPGQETGVLAARVAEAAGRLLDASKTSVLLRDPSGERLRVAAATGRKLAAEELDAVPVGSGVAGRAVASGEAIVVSDALADPRFAMPDADRYESTSFVVTPFGRGGDAFGALCATDRRGGAPFSEEDAALLRLLGLALSPLLDPKRPLEEQLASPEALAPFAAAPDASAPELGARDAELARAVCDAMTRELEPERVLHAALAAISESLHAAPVSVYLLDGASGALRREAQWEAGRGADRDALPRGRGLTGHAFESGQPVASAAPAEDPRFDAAVDTPADGRSGVLLVLPLRFRGKTLGVFRAFPAAAEAASLRTAEVLGAALSAAVRNVLLYRSLVESIEEVAQVRRGER